MTFVQTVRSKEDRVIGSYGNFLTTEADCNVDIVLNPCCHCGKKFAPDRLAIHERICLKKQRPKEKQNQPQAEPEILSSQPIIEKENHIITPRNQRSFTEQIKATTISPESLKLLEDVPQQQPLESEPNPPATVNNLAKPLFFLNDVDTDLKRNSESAELPSITSTEPETTQHHHSDEISIVPPKNERALNVNSNSHDEFPSPVKSDLVPCDICHRSFARERIEYHQSICQKHPPDRKREVYPQERMPQVKEQSRIEEKPAPQTVQQPSRVNKPVTKTIKKPKTTAVHPLVTPGKPQKTNILERPIQPRKEEPTEIPAMSLTADLTNFSSDSLKKVKRQPFGILVYLSEGEKAKENCVGELIVDSEETIIEELSLLIEEQLGLPIADPVRQLRKNGFIKIHQGQFSFRVKEIFRKEDDYLSIVLDG
ncbi:hypothetical protein BLNAU_6490 [Blattamonas nauphoetae]|uniref:C2HC/C3H-type domain-containing protein n=1 Tax=Blattamonas nauphoetae TaxID=2049346 RepID=A0ABQ9Y419_9EUKA|nr:hypothetical protein BLNAU_6490 [Blattamonas nauphoetae]